VGERRLVVTICPREPGVVRLPIERGARAVPLDAAGVARALLAAAERRGVAACVELRDGCAGGCGRDGPNVDVRVYAASDEVAVGFKTYVYSLADLPSLATIIEENLGAAPRARRSVR
jgi:hypothetical protein